MEAYKGLVERVLTIGKKHRNRTGVDSTRIVGAQIEHDMTKGFPLLTTRKLYFNPIIAELIGFLNLVTDARQYQQLGSNFWLSNASETKEWVNSPHRQHEYDLGRIYPVQWRAWRSPDGTTIDQIEKGLNEVITNPDSRRIIVQAWNPAELDLMALPPCHTEWQLIPDSATKTMSLRWTQRSCDLYLGLPANIASYASILMACCVATKYKPDRLIGQLTDVHLYANQLHNAKIQHERACKKLPHMYMNVNHTDININKPIEFINNLTVDNFILSGYEPWPALPKVKMIP